MLTTTRNQVSKKHQLLDVQEAYKLWDLVKTRYFMIDQLILFKNFTHDIDFKAILNNYINQFKNEVVELNKELEYFSIKGPNPNIEDVNVVGNSEVVNDNQIASLLHSFIKINVENLIKILYNDSTNDHVKKIFINLLKKSITQLYDFVKYLKIKGWIEIPPLYPYTNNNVKERISTNEVYHLWSHLITRYQHIYQTKIYTKYTFNTDFQLLLKAGTDILNKQAAQIEKKMLYYGVILPKKHGEIIPTPETTELYEDKFMFQTILTGMRNAAVLHGFAVNDCVLNNDVRNLFKSLLYEEIDFINRFIKYGKIKGWIYKTPSF